MFLFFKLALIQTNFIVGELKKLCSSDTTFEIGKWNYNSIFLLSRHLDLENTKEMPFGHHYISPGNLSLGYHLFGEQSRNISRPKIMISVRHDKKKKVYNYINYIL